MKCYAVTTKDGWATMIEVPNGAYVLHDDALKLISEAVKEMDEIRKIVGASETSSRPLYLDVRDRFADSTTVRDEFARQIFRVGAEREQLREYAENSREALRYVRDFLTVKDYPAVNTDAVAIPVRQLAHLIERIDALSIPSVAQGAPCTDSSQRNGGLETAGAPRALPSKDGDAEGSGSARCSERPTDPGFRYMVTGYGETEFPEVRICDGPDEVADAYCHLVFDQPFAEVLSEAQDEADEFTRQVKDHDWAEEAVFDTWRFEIGGVKVERVYARQFGKAVLGVGNPDVAVWLTRKVAEQGDLDEPAAGGGSLPSCLCCGVPRAAKVYLADHPEVYVCDQCHFRAHREPAVPSQGNSADPKARHARFGCFNDLPEAVDCQVCGGTFRGPELTVESGERP